MASALPLSTIGRAERDWQAIAADLAERFRPGCNGHDAEDSFAAESYAALKATKLFSAGVPIELGGGGASYRDLATTLRTLAKGCSSTALAFAMHTHVVALTVWRWRHDKAPVEPLLRRIAAEELVMVTSGGSDWLQSAGIAERVEGGFRVTATKRFASGSPSGDILMTSAVHDDPENGPTVLHFGVPLKAPGVTVVDNWRAHGMRGTGSGDIVIDGFFLADTAVGVRRPQGRWHRLFHTITLVAFPLIYSVYLGIAEAARDAALDGARPRAKGPDAASLAGAVQTELLAAELALEEMLRLGDEGEPGPASTARLFAAKTLATRAMLQATERALELAGGGAFRRDHPLERLSRDIQGARYHPIGEAAQLRLAGRHALGLPLDE
ncbi:MAG TPA: acyl-CoA dehydrogenase family protein [Geminicoccaceae bacterium]|nr:acyl-CoA dehydrogenase family protein [Geminicoccus sp.]HMU49215.1 acyl-CoA dehydrogenase family protein [Geminicoccaceae bacterium]